MCEVVSISYSWNTSFIFYLGVVPTTTPPLVWPYNGQNKGAPTKILNAKTMEGWI